MVKVKRIAVFTSMFILLSFSCGCTNWISRMIGEPRGVREEPRTQDIAKKNFENIYAAINDKDAQALKNIFSKNVQEESDLLDEGIDYLFSTFPEGISSFEDVFGDSYEETIQGRSREASIDKMYWLYADGTKYKFHVKTCTRNDLEPNEEGVQGILLIPADKAIKYGMRGIYIPDSFLEEHYPDKYMEYGEKSAEEKKQQEITDQE